jgi:4-amino-4-deoxy-L-arabinose transferase-like glycosyltransferase
MANEPRIRWTIVAGVAALLVLHAVLAFWSTTRRSLTVDEIFHVTGGYVFNKFGDYRIHPDNGVLPQRLHALPAVLTGAKPPPLEGNEYWRLSDISVISYQFFYESGNDHWPLLLGARAVNLLFSVGIAWLAFVWARSLAGDLAGFVALTLAALSPTLLAHGPLATTDVPAAFFLAASVGAFWWHLQVRDGRRLALSAVTFALACVTKYSAVLLLPIYAILVVVHWLASPPAERRVGWIARSALAHVVAAWAIIWACFGFRYGAFGSGVPPAAGFISNFDKMIEQVGWQGTVIGWVRRLHLLPEAFLFGYIHTYMGSLSRAAFLAGEYSTTGWRTFFPLAFLWKSTPAELAGVLLCAILPVLRLRRVGPHLVRLAPLLALLTIYGVIAVRGQLNIGHRHILPLYPVLFILVGVAIAHLAGRTRVIVAGGLMASQLAAAVAIFPSYIAYFNAFAGGPANGWRLLVDSSLDWGQDLPALKAWLGRQAAGPTAPPVFLSYFGSAEPTYYGLRPTRMSFVNGFKFPHAWYEPRPGIYCLSATMLQNVYSLTSGSWTLQFEKEYQELRRVDPQFRQYQEDPSARPHLLTLAPAIQWERGWRRYESLRHARLCAYLRARGPDDMAGYSILIFRLTEAELDAALRSSYSAWQQAIANAASGRRP